LKVNELLYRRADLADVVSAHLLALQRAPEIGFGRYIISATSPFNRNDLSELRANLPAILRRYAPHYETAYRRRGWSMFPGIDRVYVNELARTGLGWQPQYDFGAAIDCVLESKHVGSDLARAVGSKGYHGSAAA
jgi:UDP-glucose 4-epimerase